MLVENESVSERAKELFPGVKTAYIDVYITSLQDEDSIKYNSNSIKEAKEYNENNEQELNFDFKTIVVEFISGKRLEFTASEYGSIRELK